MTEQIRNMQAISRVHVLFTEPATNGTLLVGSQNLGTDQRWRIMACRFFASGLAYTNDTIAHNFWLQLEDSAGFVFAQDRVDLPGGPVVGSPQSLTPYSSPWMTFQGGLVGIQLGADLRFRFRSIPAGSTIDVNSGDFGVFVAAQLETPP